MSSFRPRLVVALALLSAGLLAAAPAHAALRAGAAVVDVMPEKLPVLLNGGMLNRQGDKVKSRVHARAIVVADERSSLALVVVDSCMMPRPLLDEAKALAARRTGIPADRILIAATHSHTAPSSMGCLGTHEDPAYVPVLRRQLVEAIAAAQANLEPARVGFARANAAEYTALRRWIRRPDRVVDDPFGNKTVRANMHAGRNWDDVTGESGPEDPDLTLIAFQARDGRPIAVLSSFSMHYFGDRDISADYFGLYADGLKQRIAPNAAPGKPAFVGAMAHGCSGDIYRVDYKVPEAQRNAKITIDEYAGQLADIAFKAYGGIQYREDADLAMAETRMTLKYRVPDKQRLEWAQRIVAAMGDRLPKDTTEVYAREQIYLHERQQTEVVVQALRIGDTAIATTPTETYAITGLKIKAASPLANTMVFDLTNGGDGYIPPPEQHLFGGYNTWAARSAGLEIMAEPKIAEAAVLLLEQVAGRPRRDLALSRGPAARVVADLKPAAWWRLDEFAGPHAADATGQGRHAIYEREVTYHLEGARSDVFCTGGQSNRAAHFVGGRLRARLGGVGERYTVSGWIWNGMPVEGRDVAGWFYSRGRDHGLAAYGDHLGIGGRSGHTGRLVFLSGNDAGTRVAGRTEIPRWEWQHVALVRDGETVRVYLNGALELETRAPARFPADLDQHFFGGRSDNHANWEGRMDEIAVFDRALNAADVKKLSAR